MRSILILSAVFFSISAWTQKTYIQCGTLIDGISASPRSNVTIVVEGNKILSVENGFKQGGPSDKLVELKNKTVMPGWMDMHVHMETETSRGGHANRFTMNPADYAFQSVAFSEVTLLAGFTTVRDLGGSGVNISLRNAINKGLITGPRIYTAGKSIATTGGHADPTNGYRADLMGDPGPDQGVINGVEDARKAVRKRLFPVNRKLETGNWKHTSPVQFMGMRRLFTVNQTINCKPVFHTLLNLVFQSQNLGRFA